MLFLINYLKYISFNLQDCVLLFIVSLLYVLAVHDCLVYVTTNTNWIDYVKISNPIYVWLCGSDVRIKINALGKYLNVPDPNTQTLFFLVFESTIWLLFFLIRFKLTRKHGPLIHTIYHLEDVQAQL